MPNWSIKIPPGIDKNIADNWRNVDAALKFINSLDNTVNSKTTGVVASGSKVKISNGDAVSDYLQSKLIAGTGITLTKSNTGGMGSEILTAAIGAHADLTNMPDTTGVNTDHDERYRVKQQIAQPTTTADFWLDTDAAFGTPFIIGDGEAGVDFELRFDGETNDGAIFWMEDEDQFKFADRVQTDGGRIGKITSVTDTYIILVSDETVVCNKATGFTVTLPVATVGQKFTIKNIGLGTVTLDANSTDKIDGNLTQSIYQYESIQVQCYVANNWSIL